MRRWRRSTLHAVASLLWTVHDMTMPKRHERDRYVKHAQTDLRAAVAKWSGRHNLTNVEEMHSLNAVFSTFMSMYFRETLKTERGQPSVLDDTDTVPEELFWRTETFITKTYPRDMAAVLARLGDIGEHVMVLAYRRNGVRDMLNDRPYGQSWRGYILVDGELTCVE